MAILNPRVELLHLSALGPRCREAPERRSPFQSRPRARRIPVVLAAMLCTSAGLAGERPTEFEVKAAYLYHFAYFVGFPASAFPDQDAPVIFAVLGKDPFGDILERTLEKKTIAGRRTAIRRFEKIEDIGECHFLFIGDSEKDRLPEILAAIEKKSVATVSDIDDFARTGGIFRFFLKEGKVRFEINIDAARKAELSISARLLQVAEVIRDRPEKKAE